MRQTYGTRRIDVQGQVLALSCERVLACMRACVYGCVHTCASVSADGENEEERREIDKPRGAY